MNNRRTRQLTAVHEVVSTAHDHPSAEQVYARVRRQLPHVSLGTVYRNLQKLVAQQQVRVVQLTDRAVRYDGMLADHDHFLCEGCGVVTDLSRQDDRPPHGHLVRAGFRVRTHTLTFHGLCPRCRGITTRRGARRRPAGSARGTPRLSKP